MADLQSIRVQRIWGIAVSVFFLFLPIATSAQVVISEIMYDAPGLEGSGEHDWIEVFNAGASAVDISAYRFFEAGTNHTLKLESGSATLPSVGYAIIASATSTFLADWPAFSGTLFDSSFNLNSAGELIGIRVDTSDTTHDFTYVPSDAATNNGSSLHRASATAATFSAGTPSPGTGSLTVTGSSSGNLNSNSNSDATATPSQSSPSQTLTASAPVSSASNFPVEPQIFAYAGKDREAIAGADSIFEARAFNKNKEQIQPGRFLWTFGDGATAEGQTVMHHFPQPGRYAVVLDIADGLFSASHQVIVTVLPVSIKLTLHNGDIVLSNSSPQNLDLSYWNLRSDGKIFMNHKNTILLGNATVPFTKEITKLQATDDAALLYPNGVVAATVAKIVAATPAPSSSTVTGANNSANVSPVSSARASYSEKEVAADSESFTDTNAQTASAAAAEVDSSETNGYVWWLGAIGMAVAGTGAVLASRRAGKKEWNIIEESAD